MNSIHELPVVEVGGRKLRVKKLLSDKGYAYVYKVSTPSPEFQEVSDLEDVEELARTLPESR